jgi:CreA protein
MIHTLHGTTKSRTADPGRWDRQSPSTTILSSGPNNRNFVLTGVRYPGPRPRRPSFLPFAPGRQIGPIKIIGDIKDGDRVFDERRSLIFKTLQVVRFFDRKRNVLVYVAYSDRFIEGSPKNSISSVPIMAWPEQ